MTNGRFALAVVSALLTLVILAGCGSSTGASPPAQHSAPPTLGIGRSLAQEESFSSSLSPDGIGPVDWRSNGSQNWLGVDQHDDLLFEVLGPSDNLTEAYVIAVIGGSSAAVVDRQVVALGEMAYQFAGKPASSWVGDQVVGVVKGGAFRTATTQASFNGYVVEVKTTSAQSKDGASIEVQVTAVRSHAATPPTTAPSSGSGGMKTAEIAWWNKQKPLFDKIENDLKAVTTAASNADATALTNACTSLRSDTTAMINGPPAPDPAILAPFQAALTDYSNGASSCIQALAQNNTPLLNTATQDFASGNTEAYKAVAAINALASS
jgi:hypothetical protein